MLITKRNFLKGLFATPVIIPINNLMPVSTKLIMANADELVSYNTWALIHSQGKKFWTLNQYANKLNISDVNIVKEVKMPLITNYYGKEANKLTVDLMKVAPGSSVFWEWSHNYLKG